MSLSELFAIATNVSKPRGITIIRHERIKREGSPPYTYRMPATASGAKIYFDPNQEFPESRKYAPLDFIQLTNNDTEDLMLRINGTEQSFAPAGSVTTVRGMGIHSVEIENLGGLTTTLKKIYAVLMREPLTIDKVAQRGGL